MPISYTLRGKRQDQVIERTGTLTDEQLAEVNVDQDSAVINLAIRNLHAQGFIVEWEECTLDRGNDQPVETYVRYKKRWTPSSKVHGHK
jgi:hypothetical protein